LYDKELEACRKLIHELYDIKDALYCANAMAIMETSLACRDSRQYTRITANPGACGKPLKDAGMQRGFARELNSDQIMFSLRHVCRVGIFALEHYGFFSEDCYMSIAGGERSKQLVVRTKLPAPERWQPLLPPVPFCYRLKIDLIKYQLSAVPVRLKRRPIENIVSAK
jgi:hypothetical protein